MRGLLLVAGVVWEVVCLWDQSLSCIEKIYMSNIECFIWKGYAHSLIWGFTDELNKIHICLLYNDRRSDYGQLVLRNHSTIQKVGIL